jgi:hypothetical protein
MVALVDLKLVILLSLPPQCWDHRCVPITDLQTVSSTLPHCNGTVTMFMEESSTPIAAQLPAILKTACQRASSFPNG